MMPKSNLPDSRPIISPAERTAVRQALAAWYDRHRRDLPWRRTRDPYAIWISEVMLQQTQVKTAIPYFQRFMDLFPDVERLARADEQTVLKVWEGLGYYSRARNMHRAAKIMQANGGRVPADRPALRQLPGIGDYIAAAVLSIAFDQPYAVVDGNVKRVVSRLLCLDVPVNRSNTHATFQAAADQLLDRDRPSRHNQAVMELGALVCMPKQPLCAQCPLGFVCQALRHRNVEQYPRRMERRPVGEQQWIAAVIVKNGHLLLTRRPAAGLLAGLWEFPSARLAVGQDPPQACIDHVRAALGLRVRLQKRIASVRHTYTHFKLRMEVYLCHWQNGRIRLNGPAAFQWVRPAQIENFALHRAMHKVLPALQRGWIY
jgi:A/G-specific adenine glycosylase